MGSMSPHRRRQQASDADESDRRLGMPQSTQRLPIRRLSGYTAAKQNPLHRGSLRDSAALRLHLPTVNVQSDGGRSCSCDECDSFGDIFHSLTWLVAPRRADISVQTSPAAGPTKHCRRVVRSMLVVRKRIHVPPVASSLRRNRSIKLIRVRRRV